MFFFFILPKSSPHRSQGQSHHKAHLTVVVGCAREDRFACFYWICLAAGNGTIFPCPPWCIPSALSQSQKVVCPMSGRPLRLKDLTPVKFTRLDPAASFSALEGHKVGACGTGLTNVRCPLMCVNDNVLSVIKALGSCVFHAKFFLQSFKQINHIA